MSEELKPRIGNYRWTICALVFFATTVNYLDRQVLSLLQPRLEEIFVRLIHRDETGTCLHARQLARGGELQRQF